MKTPSTHGLIGDLRVFFFLTTTKEDFFGENFRQINPNQTVQLTGKQLASACWDGVARIYDLEKEEEPVELRGHTGSPDAFLGAVVLDTPLKMNGWNTRIRRWIVQMAFSFAKQGAVHFPGCTKNIKKSRVDSEKG